MKVFISWSGRESHAIALALREWLPQVIQNLEPFVSSDDIRKGGRWSVEIGKKLDESSFGIICLTQKNLDAPWILFEAGALSKSFDEGRVAPLLFGINRSDVDGPLVQFQSTLFETDDMFSLLKSINNGSDSEFLSEDRLRLAFEKWWPDLEKRFQEIPRDIEPGIEPVRRTDRELLEEILEILRRSEAKITRTTVKSQNVYKSANDTAMEMLFSLSPDPSAHLSAQDRQRFRSYDESMRLSEALRMLWEAQRTARGEPGSHNVDESGE